MTGGMYRAISWGLVGPLDHSARVKVGAEQFVWQAFAKTGGKRITLVLGPATLAVFLLFPA